MSGWTNRGKYNVFNIIFRNASAPTNFYIALVTADNTPDADTNLMSDLTEIAAGNGYSTGGTSLNRNSTDFDVLTEDDDNDKGFVQVKDISWTAAGGTIPPSGSGARWVVLTDDDATVADREVWAYGSLGSARTMADGETLKLADFELGGQE